MEIKIYCLVLLYIDWYLVQVSVVIGMYGFQSCLHEYSDINLL